MKSGNKEGLVFAALPSADVGMWCRIQINKAKIEEIV